MSQAKPASRQSLRWVCWEARGMGFTPLLTRGDFSELRGIFPSAVGLCKQSPPLHLPAGGSFILAPAAGKLARRKVSFLFLASKSWWLACFCFCTYPRGYLFGLLLSTIGTSLKKTFGLTGRELAETRGGAAQAREAEGEAQDMLCGYSWSVGSWCWVRKHRHYSSACEEQNPLLWPLGTNLRVQPASAMLFWEVTLTDFSKWGI